MKYKILIAAFILFCSFTGPGDPPEVGISFNSFWRSKSVAIAGYTKINARYEWVAGAFDSGLHVPQYNGVPSGTRSGVWNADGAVAVDTSNHRLYFYSGGSWRYSTSGTGGGTPTLQQVTDAGNSTTNDFGLDNGGQSIYMRDDGGSAILNINGAAGNSLVLNSNVLAFGQSSPSIKNQYIQRRVTLTNNSTIYFPDSSGTIALLSNISTPTLQQVLTAGSTLTTNNTIDGGGYDLAIANANLISLRTQEVSGGEVNIGLSSSPILSGLSVGSSGIVLFPLSGNLKIDSLNYTLSTTGKKIMLRDTATGLVQNIDPALLGGSISLAAIGSSPNANGATISGSTLNLEPASASFGGVVTTGTQSFAGTKTFTGIVGIGASPTYNLDVFGGGFYGTVRIRGASGGGFIMGDWNSNTGGFWPGGITPTVSNYSILANNAGNTFINAASGQLVYLLTNNGTGTAGAVLGDNGLAINSGLIAPTSGNSLIVGSGRVGIGTVSPTAFFHIKAGTSSAQTAPLKFTSGTNLTTAEAGAVEYDGKDLFFTPTGTIRKVIPTIISSRSTGQTAAVGSVATQTVGASDASFMVSSNILVTTSSAEAFTTTVAYTDEGNTARTLTLNYSLLAGTIGVTIAAANGAVPYQGVPVQIRCKASTTITIATTGTFTGCTYNVEGTIQKIQ